MTVASFVFQHYALFPHMTVAENITFGARVSKVKRDGAAIEARVTENCCASCGSRG